MKKPLVAFALLSTLAASSAFAKDVKHITKTVEVQSGQKISLNVAVGSLDIETCNCNEVTLKIKVEQGESNWSIFGSGNVDDAKLTVRNRNSGLKFEVDEDDTKQKWTVTVPATSALNIDMGVGEVKVEDFNNSMNADVGVGHIIVSLEGKDFDNIKVDSGVGDATIRGFDDVDKDRAMVSASARYSGQGKHAINIDVGVGEATIR